MKNKNWSVIAIVFIFGIIIFSSVIGISGASSFGELKSNINSPSSANLTTTKFADYKSKISSQVYQDFTKGDKVRVIVNLKQIYSGPGQNLIRSMGSSDERAINTLKKISNRGDYFSAYVTQSELQSLENNNAVDFIEKDRDLKILLQNSTRIINATPTWSLQVSGINLTGTGQTVCILDTGVNSSHADLNARIIAQHCYCSVRETLNTYCCAGNLSDSADATDNNGHGTHVSGIVAASGGINGVAKGANIIMIKIMNSSGSGTTTDLNSGLDWCINNALTYNITAISMSLGDGGSYSSYCDDGLSTNQKINSAFGKNISVVVATGNDGWNSGIEWPACVQNATPVSATTKAEAIASYADRNWMVKLFAPGGVSGTTTSINSTWFTGGYAGDQGTSMATPHVSGAIAIISQYLRITNRTRTPAQIEDVLYSTGRNFTELGNNYSRINIYAAIISLDISPPNVTLSTPTNNSLSSNINQSFSCNATDLQLANLTFYLWNSSNSLVYNETKNLTGASNNSVFNVTNLNNDVYNWNCLVADADYNSAFAVSNFSLVIGNISVLLNSPSNNLNTNQNQSYNCSATTNSSLSLRNITLFIWNSSTNLIYNLTRNVTGITNSSVFSYNFSSNGNYSWNCLAFSNNSQSYFAVSNYSVNYSTVLPNISSVSAVVTTSDSILSWNTSETTNSSIVYGTNISNLNINKTNSSYSINHTVDIDSLSASTIYYYNLTNCDVYGNCITNGTYSFTTADAPAAPPGGGGSSGGGGGGGAASTPKTYNASYEQISVSYSQPLAEDDKIKFNFAGQVFGHTLTVDKVEKKSVTIEIRSSPLTINLSVGEFRKLNLTSPDYYDLFVRLESIVNNKANITIKTIHEEIPGIITFVNNETERPIKIAENGDNGNSGMGSIIIDSIKSLGIVVYVVIVILIIIALIFAIVVIKKKTRLNKKDKTIGEYKEKFNKHVSGVKK